MISTAASRAFFRAPDCQKFVEGHWADREANEARNLAGERYPFSDRIFALSAAHHYATDFAVQPRRAVATIFRKSSLRSKPPIFQTSGSTCAS
jgi:hypothetical protein